MNEAIATEDVLSRRQQRESPLYAGRVKVYPKAVRGTFRTIKWVVLVVLLGIYYVMPWIRWERGPGLPDQAVLADFITRRIYFFGIEIWPQEIYFLTGLLVLGAFGLFLATALFGRLWCGFTCPQTVWTDLYMWVERLIEGDRAERMRLDKSPWTLRKVALKVTKHTVWLLVAMATGGAWIMYFNDAPTVTVGLLTGQASVTQYFFFGLFTTTTYLLAGIAREQVCTYMCPWPRIQGALVDQDTLAVTYERWRGEPRGPIRKGASSQSLGDCIDCKQCVAVCPMGIDIRDGFQLECIGCALCIDACNSVMDKIGRPRWLIAYDSERNIELRALGQPPQYRLVRPRTILYTSVLVVVGGLMLAVLMLRSDADFNVLHERNPLFVQLSDGSIRNGYTIKIVNKDHQTRTFIVTQTAFSDAWLSGIGGERQVGEALTLTVPPHGVAEHRIFLTVPRHRLGAAKVDFAFLFTDPATGQTFEAATVFRAPDRSG